MSQCQACATWNACTKLTLAEPSLVAHAHVVFMLPQARIGIVGVNLVAIVEGKELLSFKLLDATMDMSVAGPSASSRDPDMTIGAAIQDMSIRDIQADPHCTMVLQPNAPATSCSLALEYNQWADGRVKPTLVAELTNPQFLLLFR